ncbi:sperm motility kinase 4A-like [Thomomys bottae]
MISKLRQARSRRGRRARSSDQELLRAGYRVLRTLREGGFARVQLAEHLLTDTLVAVKALDKRESPFFATELELLGSVEHPNIVRLYEVVDTEERVYLVMEYLDGGDLVDHLQKVDRLEEAAARPLFGQILRAVQYCHDHGIVHRDLKAENVLLDGKGAAKLCDFGLSARFSPGEQLTRECGTLAYWAPELFKQEGYQGPKVDVWSLGVLLYYMVMGHLPYDGRSWVVLRRQVLEGRFKLRTRFSPELKGILAYLMTADPKKRPSVWQVMHHPWLRQTEAASPSPSQVVLDRPDPAILQIMSCYLGFDPGEVRAGLSGRTFNGAMATYRMLYHQQDQSQDLRRLVRQPLPGPPPCPSPAHPSYRHVPFKRASAPDCHPATCLPAEQQQQEEEESGRRRARSVCLPCLLWNPSKTGPRGKTEGRKSLLAPASVPAAAVYLPTCHSSELPCPAPEQERQVSSRADSLPCILHNTWTWGAQRERDLSSAVPGPEASDPSWKGPGETQESSKLASESPAVEMSTRGTEAEMEGSPPPPLGSAAAETSTPANERGRGWERLKKNIASYFRKMCCCCLPH